jgi:hypothetical protein
MLCYYAECHILFTIMLTVVMLTVVMLTIIDMCRYAKCRGAKFSSSFINFLFQQCQFRSNLKFL